MHHLYKNLLGTSYVSRRSVRIIARTICITVISICQLYNDYITFRILYDIEVICTLCDIRREWGRKSHLTHTETYVTEMYYRSEVCVDAPPSAPFDFVS